MVDDGAVAIQVGGPEAVDDLAAGRPLGRPLPTSRWGCIAVSAVVGVAVMVSVEWPLSGTGEILGVVSTLLLLAFLHTPALTWQSTTTYRLIAVAPMWRGIPGVWWRAMLLFAWLPGAILLLIHRGGEIAGGAPLLGGWWIAAAMAIIAFASVFLLALREQIPVYLHALGIQGNKAHFLHWRRIHRARIAGDRIMFDIDRDLTHPPACLTLPPNAVATLVAELRQHGIPVQEGLPVMLPGKIVAVLAVGGVTALAYVLAPLAPWPATFAALIAIALGIKATEERLTGQGRLLSNRLGMQNPAVLDAAAFTEHYAVALAKADPGIEVVPGAGDLHLRSRSTAAGTDGAWCDHFLDNAFANYGKDRGRRDTIIGEFIAGNLEARSLGPISVERLIPAVRSRSLLNSIPADSGEDKQPIHKPLLGDLVLMLAEDHPQTIRYCPRACLSDLGLSEDQAWARAQANLATVVPERRIEGSDGSYLISAPWHAAALLTDPTWFTPLRFPVQGDWLVGIATRDVVLVTGTEEPKGAALLLTGFMNLAKEPHFIGQRVVIHRDGRWSPPT